MEGEAGRRWSCCGAPWPLVEKEEENGGGAARGRRRGGREATYGQREEGDWRKKEEGPLLVSDASTGATGRTWMAFGETVGTGGSYKGYLKKEAGPEEENGEGGGSEEEEEPGEPAEEKRRVLASWLRDLWIRWRWCP